MLDICRVKQKRIAKKSGSIPRFDIIGTKIGTRINIRAIQSITIPSRYTSNSMTRIVPVGPKSKDSNSLCIATFPRNCTNTLVNIFPARHISRTAVLILMVDVMESLITLKFKFPANATRISAPKQPMAPASDGDTMPKKIDPITARMRKIGGTSDFKTNLSKGKPVILSSSEIGGATSGLTLARIYT